jgi:hypothetical protein
MSDFLKILIIKRLLINKSIIHGSLSGFRAAVFDPLRPVVDKICRMYKPVYDIRLSPCITFSYSDDVDDEFEIL